MGIKDLINNYVIDYLIQDILKKDRYEELSYWNKTSICKLVVKKGKIPGRVLA